jgi:hypothetical protein
MRSGSDLATACDTRVMKGISPSRQERCSVRTSCPCAANLAAIAVFCNEVKGKSALALSRDLHLSYKSAFVLLHKLREAMAEEMKGRVVGGEGKEAEAKVDGGYLAATSKPANHKEDRKDRRFAQNQNGKRKVVVIIRERVPAVFKSESQAASFIRAHIAKGTTVHADESGAWDGLHERFEMKRINQQEATALTALALIRQRNISPACAAPRAEFITTSQGPTCFATRKKVHGVKITAASRMAIR